MWLKKHQGGCEITHRGQVYAWPEDGSVTLVPDDLGEDLVRLGGYEVSTAPAQDDDTETGTGDDDGSDAAGDDSGGDGDGGQGDSTPDPAAAPAAAAKQPRRGTKKTPAG